MYSIKAPAVYVTERANADPRCRARMQRLMHGVQTNCVRCVSDEELNEIVGDNALVPTARTGAMGGGSDTDERILLLDAFPWHSVDAEKAYAAQYQGLRAVGVLGPWTIRDCVHLRRDFDGVCQTAYELHTAEGCLHGCQYCFIGRVLALMLNLEEYVEHLDDFIKTIPWLKLFKYDNRSDQICLEPEYGASDLMVKFFASQTDRYLLLYTKSDNVDHLLDLPHGGHTIVNWSLSCDRVSREIERFTPHVTARIEAARKCQQAGYTVRTRFSPIIPIADWREQYALTTRELLRQVKPDVVTLDVIGWMSAGMLARCVNVSQFDRPYREFIEDIIRQGDPRRGKPYNPDGKHIFPTELRAPIYRHMIDVIRQSNPEQRITICMETPEMWNLFGDELGMAPEDYVCCCGPTSVPGHPLLSACQQGHGSSKIPLL